MYKRRRSVECVDEGKESGRCCEVRSGRMESGVAKACESGSLVARRLKCSREAGSRVRSCLPRECNATTSTQRSADFTLAS